MIDPTKDGIDHINIYSKGNTDLGRLLSNFAWSPIEIEDGKFNSLEGYWYWLLSDKDAKAEPLRKLYGYKAKEYGRQIKVRDWPRNDEKIAFRLRFMRAMRAKIEQQPHLAQMLAQCTLPFEHYYVYNGKASKVPGCKWMLGYWDQLREGLQDAQNVS
jgi:hypothetical protein